MIDFIDLETTGLDPERHAITEIGIVLASGDEISYFLEPTYHELVQADATALRLNKYYPRRQKAEEDRARWVAAAERGRIAIQLASLLTHHLGGNVVSFDERRLGDWLRKHGAAPSWHYHLLDVEAFAAGALGISPPWKSTDLSSELGVAVPEGDDRHSALADARWAKAMYEATMELQNPTNLIEMPNIAPGENLELNPGEGRDVRVFGGDRLVRLRAELVVTGKKPTHGKKNAQRYRAG